METVSRDQVGTSELALPPRVQEALGQLVSSAKEAGIRAPTAVGVLTPVLRSAARALA